MFVQAAIFYSISIIKNLIVLLLIRNQTANVFFRYSLYGSASVLIFSAIANLVTSIDPKVGMCNFITALFLFMLHENMLYNTICYYANILCVYWIVHSSFYFIKLYFKYDTFKKSINDYEKNYKIPLLIEKQKEKLTIFI